MTERVLVGIEKTSTVNEGHEWAASVSVAYNGVASSASASASYAGYIQTQTISVSYMEREEIQTITIEPGQATALWQWVISMTMNNVVVRIPTEITWTTDSPSVMPDPPASN